MAKPKPVIDRRDPRDVRSNPDRGVSIEPMPPFAHEAFRRFLDSLRKHAQSNRSTWIFAHKDLPIPYVQERIIYWKNVIHYLNTVEYLGTTNESAGSLARGNRRRRRNSR